MWQNWHDIGVRYPQISIIALQMMPDHFHGILFVKARIEKPLGKVLLGFKQGCNKAFRELVPSVAVLQQQTQLAANDRHHGLLFARGYNDRLLLREGQLDTWLRYLADNPRRLLMKREHPDLFRVQRGLIIGGQSFSAIGNRFLLQRPVRLQVQCPRRLTAAEIEQQVNYFFSAAAWRLVLGANCSS